MSENTLIPIDDLGLAPAKYADDKQFGIVAASAAFLPRLQLFGANSEAVKEVKIPMGHYGLVRTKDSIDDLTSQVDVLVASWRPKAMRVGGDQVVSVYDPSKPEFIKIQELSEVQDSACMFGPEFLVWIPTNGVWAGFFMASKTARRVAPEVKALMHKAATLKVQLIKTKKYSWHGPVCVPCSTPFNLPLMEEVRVQIGKFNSPPEEEVESAPAEQVRAR